MNVATDVWRARGHARPGRADDRRHRHHGRRAGLRDRARARPPRRARGPRRAHPRPARGLRARHPRRRSPTPRSSRLQVDVSDLGSVRRAARAGRRPRADRRARQQRRRDGHGVHPDRRRPRAADGDQPLRAVPAHRAAAPAAGRQRRRPRRDRLLADAPDRPPRAARRPAPAAGPLLALAGLRADEAGQPALHLRARPPGPPRGAAGQGARRPPRLRGHPPRRERALRPRQPAAGRRSSTPRSGRSPSPRRWARCRP